MLLASSFCADKIFARRWSLLRNHRRLNTFRTSKTEGPSSRTVPDTPRSRVDLSACLFPFFRGRGRTSREGAATGGTGDGAGGEESFRAFFGRLAGGRAGGDRGRARTETG